MKRRSSAKGGGGGGWREGKSGVLKLVICMRVVFLGERRSCCGWTTSVVDEHDSEVARDESEELWCFVLDGLVEDVLVRDERLRRGVETKRRVSAMQGLK